MKTMYIIFGFILLITIIIFLCLYKKPTENLCTMTDKAPWILHKTPIPKAFILTIKDDPILEKSVDPGAHIECQEYCKTLGPITDKMFQQTCINICLQKKWTQNNKN